MPSPLPLGTVPHPMRPLPAEDRQFQPIRNLILPLLIHVAFSFASQAVMFTACTIHNWFGALQSGARAGCNALLQSA
jgi:hypothetical protein